MDRPFLIYGAYGYTGALITRMAVERGMRPVLGGRAPKRLEALASRYGLEMRAFSLGDPLQVDEGLAGMGLVLHCAGPFVDTASAMAEGCLRTGTHYADITGEVEVFEALAAMDAAAKAAGVMLLPGGGFDVVPTDCLALFLKEQLPDATELALGFMAEGSMSHGTALTIINRIDRGTTIRRNGKLEDVPGVWGSRDIDFGEGERKAVSIAWGDVASAYYSTGIPNIAVYMAAPAGMRLMLHGSKYLGPMLGADSVKRFLKGMVKAGGPSDAARAKGYSLVWGEVRDGEGNRREARLRTLEGYTLTVEGMLRIAERVAAGDAPAGFQTPAKAYGADFVLELPETEREVVSG